MMRRLLPLFFLFSCSRFVSQQQPITLDLVADAGGGCSAFSSSALSETLSRIIPQLAEGSVIRLHVISDTVEESRELGSFQITGPKQRSAKAIARHREQLTREAQQYFGDLAATLLLRPTRRSSPIAETIARVLLADAVPGTQRVLAIFTDGKQYSSSASLGRQDWECGEIPTADEFAPHLAALIGTTAKNVRVCFVNAQNETTNRAQCPGGIERYARLRATWVASFSRLGADVTWSTRPVVELKGAQ